MTASILFLIIVLIIIANQLFDFTFSFLNRSYRNKPIPKVLEGIYDDAEYTKQQSYEADNSRFSLWSSLVSFVGILLILFFDGFAYLDNLLRDYLENEIYISLLFFGILMFLSSLISLPFSLYSTFVIEEKYGFNRTTVKTFFFDLIKGAFLSVIIGGALLYIIILLYQTFGSYFWLLTWGIVTAFMLFLNMFYSQLIVPLFNKQTPLEEGSLRSAIEAFSRKAGFQLKNIFVIDGSKRSSKANAYFAGLGSKKRIVLYDTLIEELEEEEIVAVLAHEVGHYKHKHTLKGMITSVIQTGLILYLFSLVIDQPLLNQALGSNHTTFHFGLIVFSFLFEPFSMVLGILSNMFSRKNEYEADAFAKSYGLGDALISGLKRLSKHSLSNLTPHPAFVFVHYSHPSLYQRIVHLIKL